MSEQQKFYKVGDEDRPMPVKSGTQVQAEGLKQLIERQEEEARAKSTQEIKLDGTNEVSFPGFPYTFKALNEKILVSIDVFKSGYECKQCKGAKFIETVCECEQAGHPGIKYGTTELERISNVLGADIANSRSTVVCPTCGGFYVDKRSKVQCPACEGKGAILHIPDSSKNLPTTGIVVSIGNQIDRSKLDYGLGDRVLFSSFSGSMIPTKAGLMLKVMDANAVWLKIKGGAEMDAFEFILDEEVKL